MAADAFSLLDGEVLDRIRQLELFSRFRVEGFMNGMNQSPYKGFTADFLQHRQYARGDDLKYLDWRLYAKTDKLYIKEYEELTNTRISIVVDVSNSMSFAGEGALSKHGYTVRCAALIAYLAHLHKDSFALATFATERRLATRFGSSKRHLYRLLGELVGCKPSGETDFADGLHQATADIRRQGLTIVLSDFMDDPEKIVRTISRLRLRGSDVVAMQIVDPAERQLDFNSVTRFHDLESDDILVVDPVLIEAEYRAVFDAHLVALKEACQRHGFDHVVLEVADDYEVALMAYVRHRMELFT